MIVAISYGFHDYERRSFALDTSRLDPNHRFEAAVKAAVEGPDDYATIQGQDFDDDFGDLQRYEPSRSRATLPCRVDKVMNLDVRFE
jgi:hypothetical protein